MSRDYEVYLDDILEAIGKLPGLERQIRDAVQ